MIVSAAALLGGVALAADGMKLEIKYPKPLFEGTFKPINLPSFDPVLQVAPVIKVPSDTVLLSRGKPVTSSDSLPVIGEMTFVTDGDKGGFDGTFVELGPGPQWVQIDLGSPARIHAVNVWHFHAQARVYHAVAIQISDDAAFKKGVTTVFNNDHANVLKLGRGLDRPYAESNFGRLIDAKGTRGRYVRLYSNGNTSDELNHYCEVEVYGIPGAK